MHNRYRDWLSQAENDLAWGNDTLDTGHFAQACFIAQQCSEKALKALAYYRGYQIIKGHSIREIALELKINSTVLDAAKKLDLYYMTTRYPDALPSGAPFEYFTPGQASEALILAKTILLRVQGEIDGEDRSSETSGA